MKPVQNIETVDQLRVLTDPTRLEILEQCMRPRTVTELAEMMEVPRTRLYHHVGLLQRAGFLEVVETREVGPLTERVYQATADSFTPSPALLATDDLRLQVEAVSAGIFGLTQADLARSLKQGNWSLGRSGRKRGSLSRSLLMLNEAELAELVQRLRELIEQYDRRDDGDPDRFPVAVVHAVYPSAREGR